MKHKKITIFIVCLFCVVTSLFANEWELKEHTERYDDHVSQGWYIQKAVENVRVSNGTSSSGLATIIFKFSAPDLMMFSVYEDGLENPPKKFYKADYTYYTLTDDKGQSVEFAVDTSKGNGNTITSMNALAVRRMMMNSPYIRGTINIENITYDFLMNTFEFRQQFIDLCHKLDYTDEEIERAIGHESAIFDSLFRKVCAQMKPYYNNSSKIYSSVNVKLIENAVNDVKELFPEFADNILYEFHKISYAEWLSFFSMKYNKDITELKNMNEVEDMFELLTVEITPIDEMPMISHSPLIDDLNRLDKLNGEDMTAEYEKPLPVTYKDEDDGLTYLKAEDKRGTYIKFKSYGLGLTITSANQMTYKMSGGLAFEINGFFNEKHGMNVGLAYINDGTYNGFDQYLGYTYRKRFTKAFEMLFSPSLVLNLKNVPCHATNNLLYGDKVFENIIGYVGLRADLGFNWFIKDNFFMTFGIADRLIGPGFTLLDRYVEDDVAKFVNTTEAYIGVGLSF